MKDRLQKALTAFPIKDWSASIFARKAKAYTKMNEWPEWTKRAFKWDPHES